MDLKAAFYATPYFYEHNRSTGKRKGLSFDLMEQLGIEAGFTVEYLPDPVKNDNETWTDFPKRMLLDYRRPDVVGPWFVYGKMVANFSSQIAYVPNSFVMLVSKPRSVKAGVDWFNWAAPFTWETWALVTLLIALSGVAIWFFEREDEEDEDFAGTTTSEGMAKGVQLSMETFTGMGGFSPDTFAGKLTVWSLSFSMVLILAAVGEFMRVLLTLFFFFFACSFSASSSSLFYVSCSLSSSSSF
jgi:hypothetical protein